MASPFLCIISPSTENAGVVKMLLAREDVTADSKDANGRTPLSYAAGNGSRGAVKLLLRRGDVNPASLDKDDRTPLWHAAQSWHYIVARKLSKRRPFNHQASPIPYPFDEYLLNLRAVHPVASAPAPISTFDTTPDPTITKPSGPPKRHPETQPPLRRSKRKRFPPS